MENIIEQLENKEDRVIDIIEDKIKKFDDRLWIEYPDDKNEISNEVFRYITYEGILDYSEICSTYIHYLHLQSTKMNYQCKRQIHQNR